MEKPICLQSEIVWPFRNGIAMAALVAMVFVAAMDRGIPLTALTYATAVFLAALGVALGGYVPRMQRPERNDESGDLVAILTFGYTYWGAGCLVFRCILDDWEAAFEVARVTAFTFMVGGSIGVLLLTVVRGTTRELLTDLGFADPVPWQAPEESELEEWLPPDAEDSNSRYEYGWPRSAKASAAGSIRLLLTGLDCARQPDEPEVPASRSDGHSAGGDRPFSAVGQEHLGSPEGDETAFGGVLAGTADRYSASGPRPAQHRPRGQSRGW